MRLTWISFVSQILSYYWALLVAIDMFSVLWSSTNMWDGCLFAFPPLNNSKASPRRSSLLICSKGLCFCASS